MNYKEWERTACNKTLSENKEMTTRQKNTMSNYLNNMKNFDFTKEIIK